MINQAIGEYYFIFLLIIQLLLSTLGSAGISFEVHEKEIVDFSQGDWMRFSSGRPLQLFL
jgi:hypothetical protein